MYTVNQLKNVLLTIISYAAGNFFTFVNRDVLKTKREGVHNEKIILLNKMSDNVLKLFRIAVLADLLQFPLQKLMNNNFIPYLKINQKMASK
jgi:hypothetical protein